MATNTTRTAPKKVSPKRSATKTKRRSAKSDANIVKTLKPADTRRAVAKTHGFDSVNMGESPELVSARLWAEAVDELNKWLLEYVEDANRLPTADPATGERIRDSMRCQFDVIRDSLTELDDPRVPPCLRSVLELIRDVGKGEDPATLKCAIEQSQSEINRPNHQPSFQNAVVPTLDVQWPGVVRVTKPITEPSSVEAVDPFEIPDSAPEWQKSPYWISEGVLCCLLQRMKDLREMCLDRSEPWYGSDWNKFFSHFWGMIDAVAFDRRGSLHFVLPLMPSLGKSPPVSVGAGIGASYSAAILNLAGRLLGGARHFAISFFDHSAAADLLSDGDNIKTKSWRWRDEVDLSNWDSARIEMQQLFAGFDFEQARANVASELHEAAKATGKRQATSSDEWYLPIDAAWPAGFFENKTIVEFQTVLGFLVRKPNQRNTKSPKPFRASLKTAMKNRLVCCRATTVTDQLEAVFKDEDAYKVAFGELNHAKTFIATLPK